jgi:hypothetical protein
MTDVKKDILEKISSLVEKRDVEVLSERDKAGDDFPMLTEVIACDIDHSASYNASSDLQFQTAAGEFVERRVNAIDRRQSVHEVSAAVISSDVYLQLVRVIEARMTSVLSKHQLLLEQDLHQVIQEEIGKILMANDR